MAGGMMQISEDQLMGQDEEQMTMAMELGDGEVGEEVAITDVDAETTEPVLSQHEDGAGGAAGAASEVVKEEVAEAKEAEGEEKKGMGKKEWAAEVKEWVRYNTVRPGGGWMQQCSRHLSHIEKRLMEADYLGHEVVRQIGILLEAFSPPPRGDWGWLLRQALDIAVRTLRQIVRYYLRDGEKKEEFVGKAILLVRLFLRRLGIGRCWVPWGS